MAVVRVIAGARKFPRRSPFFWLGLTPYQKCQTMLMMVMEMVMQ